MNQKIPAVFPVVTKEINLTVYQSHGSAFFIDAKGLFVTAAHTFKNPFRENYALIKGERFEITRVWSEYTDLDYQQPKIYQDLFIGRIKDFDSPEFYQLRDITTDLPRGAELKLEGYHQHLKPAVQPVTQEPIDLDDLYEDVLDDDYQGLPTQEEEKAGLLRLDPIAVTYLQQGFKHIDKYATLNEEFTNGFSISMEVKEPHGHSGGPLLYQGKVAGMLIGENAVISVEYIKEKLAIHLARTQGKLPEKPAMAVDVSADNEWLENLIASIHDKLNVPGSLYESQWRTLCFVSAADAGLLKNIVDKRMLVGFGGTQSNYLLDKISPVHLVVLTPNTYKEAELTFPELQAVVMHEIGHVLNKYEQKTAPMFKGTDQGEMEAYFIASKEVREGNQLNNELYADDYVRQQGYVLPLVGSMKKYLNTTGAENIDLMNKRIQYFEKSNNNDLVGTVNILR